MNYCRQIFGDPTPHHSIEVFLPHTCSLLHHFCVSPTDFNCSVGAGTWYFQNDLGAETNPLARTEVSWMRTFEPFDEALSHQPIVFLNFKRTAAWKKKTYFSWCLLVLHRNRCLAIRTIKAHPVRSRPVAVQAQLLASHFTIHSLAYLQQNEPYFFSLRSFRSHYRLHSSEGNCSGWCCRGRRQWW